MELLIVDDNTELLPVLSECLMKPGLNISVAKDGEEAIKILKTRPIDVVLTDFEMPKVNGIELITAIQNSNTDHRPVVILMSGNSWIMEQEIEGIFMKLAKPIDINQLKNVISLLSFG